MIQLLRFHPLQVCADRSFAVLPIMEHLYDMGNLAAVCRSADGALCAVRALSCVGRGLVERSSVSLWACGRGRGEVLASPPHTHTHSHAYRLSALGSLPLLQRWGLGRYTSSAT